MAYGKIKADTLTFDNSGTDSDIAVSGIPTAAQLNAKANTSDIGSTIQAFDADTAKTDVAQNFTAAQRGAISAIAVAAGDTTKTLDFATANNFELTLANTNTCTLNNPSNLTAGQSGSIFVVQDSTGGRILNYGSSWEFAGGSAGAPTLSTAGDAVDRIDYIVRSGTSIHAVFTAAYS
jgi:hypothetical protein